MKKILAISAAIISFTLVGAGCGTASPSGSGASGSAGVSAVSAAFKTAQIAFTVKDKTSEAKTALGADADQLATFAEYKFSGSGLILLVGEVKDENNRPRIADKLSDSVKAQAKVASLDYTSVGGLNNKKWFVFTLSKEADSAAKTKALGAISK